MLENYLQQYYGYNEFRPHQKEIIEAILNKEDVLAILPTSHGKSICYQLPAIISGKPSIVLTPLISLMMDQQSNLAKLGIKSCTFNSVNDQKQLKVEILTGNYLIVYITPEALINSYEWLKSLNNTIGIGLFAVDESHCVLWGDSFREAYNKLDCLKEWFPTIPILALTGTATKKVINDIVDKLKLEEPLFIKTSLDRPNIYFEVKPKGKLSDLVIDQCTIIYCQTRKKVEKTANELQSLGVSCLAYHAGLTDKERTITQDKFMNGEIICVVATNAFGLGINKDNVRQVLHIGSPKDVESFCQEFGRAGRDGKPSKSIVYFSNGDFHTNHKLISDLTGELKEYKEEMCKAMEKYAYTTECRRKFLLSYFDQVPEFNEHCCDNCDNLDSVELDLTDQTRLFLNLATAYPFKFGKVKLISCLKGSKAKDLPKTLTNCKFFNLDSNTLENWKNTVQHISNAGFIKEVSTESGFGMVVGVDALGKEWLSKNERFTVRVKNEVKIKKIVTPKIKEVITPEIRDRIVITPEIKRVTNYEIRDHIVITSDTRNIVITPDIKRLIFGDLIINVEHKLDNNVKLAKITTQNVKLPQIATQNIKLPQIMTQNIKLPQIMTQPKSDKVIETKAKKLTTHQQTYELFHNEGKSIDEISQIRGIKSVTLEDHLAKCLKEGLLLRTSDLNLTKNIYDSIVKVINELGIESKLRPILSRCAKSINYLQIKIVLAMLETNLGFEQLL